MDADKSLNISTLHASSNVSPLSSENSSSNISASSELVGHERGQGNVLNFCFYSSKSENEKVVAKLLSSAQKLTW